MQKNVNRQIKLPSNRKAIEMENKNLEYIILYLIVGCATLFFAAMARLFSIVFGIDNFTANVIFFIAIGIAIVVYLSIKVLLENVMLPWIGKTVLSMNFFKKRIKVKKPIKQNSINQTENALRTQLKPNLNEIREAHLQTKIEEQKKSRQVAILYTKTVFAPYVSDDDLERLCSFVEMYSVEKNLDEIKPVKVSSQLNTTDIYHFGWNIWNHFRISNQESISLFLKKVFANVLHEVSDVETIKKKLRIADTRCVIQLNNNLNHQD